MPFSSNFGMALVEVMVAVVAAITADHVDNWILSQRSGNAVTAPLLPGPTLLVEGPTSLLVEAARMALLGSLARITAAASLARVTAGVAGQFTSLRSCWLSCSVVPMWCRWHCRRPGLCCSWLRRWQPWERCCWSCWPCRWCSLCSAVSGACGRPLEALSAPPTASDEAARAVALPLMAGVTPPPPLSFIQDRWIPWQSTRVALKVGIVRHDPKWLR